MKTYIFRVQYGVFPSQILYSFEAPDLDDAREQARRTIPVRRSTDLVEYLGTVVTP